ncbi:MAG: hypothetical protein GXZ11_05495 [Tissierellia bacterium]|nr:hypothetical protein [Tissierellia bacterium]
MKIIKIVSQPKHQFLLCLDNGNEISIGEDVLIKYNLSKDLIVDESFIDTILNEDTINKCFNRGLFYLGYGMRTKKQLCQYLTNKGFEEEVSQEAVSRLEKKGYINDLIFAQTLIDNWSETKSYGKKVMLNKLYERGFSKETIENIAFPSEDSLIEKAKELAVAKWPSIKGKSSYDRKGKLYRYLYSRGFDYDTISKVMGEIEDE